MERQDQNPIEPLESQMGASPLNCLQRSTAPRPYCAPQVLLVGKATRLMAGGGGDTIDYLGGYANADDMRGDISNL